MFKHIVEEPDIELRTTGSITVIVELAVFADGQAVFNEFEFTVYVLVPLEDGVIVTVVPEVELNSLMFAELQA